MFACSVIPTYAMPRLGALWVCLAVESFWWLFILFLKRAVCDTEFTFANLHVAMATTFAALLPNLTRKPDLVSFYHEGFYGTADVLQFVRRPERGYIKFSFRVGLW